jgi:Right handed beta helix region
MLEPNSRNGSNNAGPQIMSGFLNKDYMYGIHITLDSNAVAFRWHEPTNTYQTFDLTLISSNELELPLVVPSDDHYTLNVGVDNLDRMYIIGNHHDSSDTPIPTTPHFVRCTNTSDFTNVASWSVQPATHFQNLDNDASPITYCYHLFERLTDGTLLHFLSQSEGGGAGSNGRDWLAFKCISGVWTPLIEPTAMIPSVIDQTGTTDVTSEINTWLATLVNGTTAIFRSGATYRVEGTLLLSGKTNVTLDGNGCTIEAQTLAGTTGNPQTRKHMEFRSCINLAIKNFTINGMLPTGWGSAANSYDEDYEGQHGISVYGCTGVDVSYNTVDMVRGDLFYFGRYAGLPSTDIWMHNNTGSGCGRQGVSLTDCIDVLIEDNTIEETARSTFDLEPLSAGTVVQNVMIRDNAIGPGRLNFLAAGGTYETSNITIRNNTLTTKALTFSINESPISTTRWSNWWIHNNTSDAPENNTPFKALNVDTISVVGNTQACKATAVAGVLATSCSGVSVHDNNWPLDAGGEAPEVSEVTPVGGGTINDTMPSNPSVFAATPWTPTDGHFATTATSPPEGEANRVYVNGVHVEPNGGGAGIDRIHAYGCFRTNDSDADSQQAPWYLYCNNDGIWRNVDGTTHTMPLTWGNRTAALITSAPSFSRNTRMGVYVDPATGFPSVIVRNGNSVTDPAAPSASYVRLSWNGTTWTTEEAAAGLSGELRDICIKGERWVRHGTSFRCALKHMASGKVIRIGGNVLTSGTVWSPNHCPVWLRERNIYAVNIGKGDTPVVYTFGNGAKLRT